MSDSLLEKEYEPHYQSWKVNPTPQTTGKLLNAIDPVLRTGLTTFAGGASTSPTLRSRAKIIALNALPGYDSSKAKLKTYLLSHLQGLHRYAAKEEKILSVPEQIGLDAHHLYESETRLRDKLGRDPSDVELADHTGLSRKRLAYIRSVKPSFTQGQITRQTDEGEIAEDPTVVQHNTDMSPLHEFLYHDLDGPSQVIFEHSFGLHNKPILSNSEIAKKLKISPGAVSQRRAKIQQMLDEASDLRIFG